MKIGRMYHPTRPEIVGFRASVKVPNRSNQFCLIANRSVYLCFYVSILVLLDVALKDRRIIS